MDKVFIMKLKWCETLRWILKCTCIPAQSMFGMSSVFNCSRCYSQKRIIPSPNHTYIKPIENLINALIIPPKTLFAQQRTQNDDSSDLLPEHHIGCLWSAWNLNSPPSIIYFHCSRFLEWDFNFGKAQFWIQKIRDFVQCLNFVIWSHRMFNIKSFVEPKKMCITLNRSVIWSVQNWLLAKSKECNSMKISDSVGK